MPRPRKALPAETRPGAHVVGDAAGADAGTGTDTQPSSDWLAELHPPAPPAPPGVAISTRPRDAAGKGRAVESKRGQRT